MRNTCLFILLLFAGNLPAQAQTIRQLALLTEGEEERNEFTIRGSWLQSSSSQDEATATSSRKSFLRQLHFLNVPITEAVSPQKIYRQLAREGFELLSSFRSNGHQGYILIKENPKGITELVALLSGEENSLSSISLSGLFSLDDLDSFNITVDGWEEVKKAKSPK